MPIVPWLPLSHSQLSEALSWGPYGPQSLKYVLSGHLQKVRQPLGEKLDRAPFKGLAKVLHVERCLLHALRDCSNCPFVPWLLN